MSDPNNPNNSTPQPPASSIFQTPGGPPLILVCIAAGLLLGAFLGVVIMRRFRPTAVVQRAPGRGFDDPSASFGEKPTLFDVHILPPDQDQEERGSAAGLGKGASASAGKDGRAEKAQLGAWAHLSPFAAAYLPPLLPPSAAKSSSSNSLLTVDGPARLSRSPLAWARRVLRWRSGDGRASHDPHAPVAPPADREVLLAVTVSMPSPPRLHPYHPHAPVHDDDDHEENPVPDCCIGTVVVSYRADAI